MSITIKITVLTEIDAHCKMSRNNAQRKLSSQVQFHHTKANCLRYMGTRRWQCCPFAFSEQMFTGPPGIPSVKYVVFGQNDSGG